MLSLLAAAEGNDFVSQITSFFTFVTEHWQFCLLHFLEFAIWGAWFVVLGNLLNARGFSRKEIGRIYGCLPIGSMISPLLIGGIADKFVNTEVLIGVSHLLGAFLLFMMARAKSARPFYWLTFLYALVFAPTLILVNSIVFAHDADIFGGNAGEGFPWIRVFGTIGWILAGLSHAIILKKGQPVNERPLLLACGLSVILGLFAFTLPETKPSAVIAEENAAALVETGEGNATGDAAADDPVAEAAAAADGDAEATPEPGLAGSIMESARGVINGWGSMLKAHPVFFGVTFVAAMAMGLYFAFAALFIEKTGVPAKAVGPVMTIGQFIEIFFMLTLPLFLARFGMEIVLLIGVSAWAIRFGLFTIGRPLALVLIGIAIHGICFDFFFAAGFINTAAIAPAELTATAQALYGFLVYGLGMYVGSEASGWLNQFLSKTAPAKDGKEEDEIITNWRLFWAIPCVILTICAIIFAVTLLPSAAS